MTQAAKIGLFALIGLVILAGFIIKIEDLSLARDREPLLVRARFASAAGVDRRAAVRIAGVRVGKVEEVALDGGQALLVLSLDTEVTLRQGAWARIANMGMLGDKYVEVFPGDPDAAPLPEGTVLEGKTPPSFDDVLQVATEIGADVKEVTAALRSSVGGEQGADKIAEIVDNIRELTASLKVLIRDNQANVNATTANFRDFSATLKDELPRIADKMNRLADQLSEVVDENRDDLHGTLGNLRDLSDRLRVSADNLNTITDKMARGEGTIGKLIHDETTVDNLNQTMEVIQDGVATLGDTVGRVRRFRLDMNFRGEGLAEHSDGRTAFGFDLWTTESRFVRLEGVDTPFGRTRTKTEIITTIWEDGSQDSLTRSSVRTEDRLGINAQFGYLLFPSTTVRAGLFESEGGVGIDHTLELARHPLRLTLEAYDFNRDIDSSPHLRLEGRLYVNSNIFVMAGWDDPTFAERSSLLFGAGVSWTDEDHKYKLGQAGSAIR
jgi:phospholipid/cholesterol/gamma-HCH transport system substrate-binding protein